MGEHFGLFGTALSSVVIVAFIVVTVLLVLEVVRARRNWASRIHPRKSRNIVLAQYALVAAVFLTIVWLLRDASDDVIRLVTVGAGVLLILRLRQKFP